MCLMKGIEGRNFKMLNAEKYKDEILTLLNKKQGFAIKPDNPTVIRNCNDLICTKCLFF